MREASPVKFYFAKYFFLAFGLLQWSCGIILVMRGIPENNIKGPLLFFSVGLLFIVLYFLVAAKLKRVAFGKKRIIVMDRNKTQHYEWPEIKSIKMIPYINCYKLKIRGKKQRIYFLPDQNSASIYGMFQSEPQLAEMLKKKGK